MEVRHYSPPTFTDLIALTGQIDAVLCNDSAMSHLAAALGKQVVSIWGPSDPGQFAPYRNQKNMVIQSVCAFRPCMDRCLMSSPVCMQAVQVEAVIEKVQAVQLQMAPGGHDENV